MNIVGIKGTSTYIRFILEDGTYIKGNGEFLVNGFCVYKDTLHLVADNETSPIPEDETQKLITAVASYTAKNPSFIITFA